MKPRDVARTGSLLKEAAPQLKAGGWHPVEWLCEFAGTAAQLFLALCVVAALESPLSPLHEAIPHSPVRLALIGAGIGLLSALVSISPLGRRSGAHLNPAVTLGFWARGQTHLHDLAGYVIAQCLGAVLGAFAFTAVLGDLARTAGYARTEPELSGWAAVGIEVVLTFFMVLTVLLMLSSAATARWTPLAVTVVLAILLPLGGPPTGASMNPARSLGPDVATADFASLWVYLVGPTLGAVLAAAAYPVVAKGRKVLTAKLFHDPRYRTTHLSWFAQH